MPITSLPNLLTLSRILAIPVVIATFYVPGDYARWFACALFSAVGVTDWLDGHMARRWEQQSEIGRFLDPIADKLLVSATLFMLTAFGRLSAEALLPALVILFERPGLRASRVPRRAAGRHAGLPACQMEDGHSDGRDRGAYRRRRRPRFCVGRRGSASCCCGSPQS